MRQNDQVCRAPIETITCDGLIEFSDHRCGKMATSLGATKPDQIYSKKMSFVLSAPDSMSLEALLSHRQSIPTSDYRKNDRARFEPFVLFSMQCSSSLLHEVLMRQQ